MRPIRRTSLAVACLSLVCALAGPVSAAGATDGEVRASTGTYQIPTYQLGPQNPYARFHQLSGKITYPYLDQQFFLNRKEPRTYRALRLENEYLKLTVLPELGGRVIEVVDKTTGEQMFHANEVLKPARIALRGAFFSGGIEWNAGPQGHTTIVYSPVNARLERHEDGSASVVVSNTQQDSRVRWRVRLTLRPGRASLEQHIRLANETDRPVPYYFWNNTAFYCDPQTRYVAPFSLATNHGRRRFYRWPIHGGRDLRKLGNFRKPTALFALDCVYDFFGAYHVGRDRGLVQWADHRELPGKKYWTFGEGQHGRYRQSRLTDTPGSHYIEVQSGPLRTQSDYEFLQPRDVRSWSEWWYPVHGLKDGFEYASRDVAIRAAHDKPADGDPGRVRLRLIATAAFPEATVEVSQGGRTLTSRSLDLSPRTATRVEAAKPKPGPVKVAVRDGDGRTLASYTSPLAVPQTPAPEPSDERKPASAGAHYQEARERQVSMDPDAARRHYKQALEDEPRHVGALRGLATLDLAGARYEQAARRLRKAIEVEPAAGMSHYYYGVALLSTGRDTRALEHAREAIRRPETQALGWDLAGRIYMRRDQPRRAASAFEKAAAGHKEDLRARVQLAVARRAAGQTEALDAALAELLAADSTELTGRALRTMRDGSFDKAAFGERMRTMLGDPVYEAITAASVLAEMARYELAGRILESVAVAGVDAADRDPLALYWLAWLAHRRGDEAQCRSWREKAGEAAHETVYPSRRSDMKVLRAALDHEPENPHLRLYMGNLLGGLGRIGEAVSHWRAAAKRNEDLGSAWRHLAKYHWKVMDDPRAADRLYERAIAAHPKVQTLYPDRAAVLGQLGRHREAIRLLTGMPHDGERRDSVVLALARAYLKTDRYSKAIEQLTGHYFYPAEGEDTPQELFAEALRKRGQKRIRRGDVRGAQRDFRRSQTYPENFGIGREFAE